MAYPWQAALAAALFLVRDAAQKAAADVPAAALEVYGSLATVEQRRSAAAASLRIVDPNHSRNTWLSASKGAEAASASGMLLHYVLQLRQLLQRTSRRTVPPTLEAYLTLAVRALPAALQAEADMPTAASGRGPVLPSAFVGTLVRSFAKYPPLLAGSVNAASGGAIPRLAVVGVPSPEAAAYTAAVLWLAVHPRVKPALPRPEWLLVHVPEATAHPIAAATPAARAAAAAACLPLLMGSLDGLLADMEGESGSAAVLPFLDVCTAAFFCLHHEWEAFKGADGAAPQPALLLGSSSSELDHASLITPLMFTLGASADKLASLLDAGGDSGCGLLAAEALAGCLAVGLEFVDVLQPLPNLLRQIGSETYSDHGPKHHAAAQALETALEKAEGSQASCLELLRTLPEDGPAYVAAARGLETAPGLCLPADANFGGDEAAKEDGMAQAKQQGNGEGHLASGDGPARSTRGLTAYQRRKRLQDIRNPYLRAIVAESRRAAGDAADGDLSDLEDFIVTNPERDYGEFIADHFPMAPESDEGESGDEDDEG